MNNSLSASQKERLKGVYALLLTPYLHNKEIDWNVYDQYIDWQLEFRPHGLMAVCGSSEMECLSLEERLALARRAVERAGETPVIATGNVSENIEDHKDEVLRMADTGVSGVVLITPGEYGRDPVVHENYFTELVELSPVPIFLYEAPLRKPKEIAPAIYGRLVDRGVIGIKDTTCTLEGIRAKIEAAPNGYVYQANASYMLESILAGAKGIMATTTTAGVDVALRMWDHLESQEVDQAKVFHELLVFLDGVLGKGYPSTAKQIVSLRGVPMNTVTRKDKKMDQSAIQGVKVWLEAAERALST